LDVQESTIRLTMFKFWAKKLKYMPSQGIKRG